MNQRNKYFGKRPDFKKLSEKHASLSKYLIPLGSSTDDDNDQQQQQRQQYTINFRDANALRQLTKVLLLEDYGIVWDLPERYLVPPVTNRANYVHWIKDLLEYVVGDHRGVRGVDVGVGANCIYCLLGASIYKWRMLGTDVDKEALRVAQGNIDRNPHLSHLIELRQNRDANKILCGVIDVGDDNDGFIADFVMCNPPFFEYREEQMRNPRTACPATESELVYRPNTTDDDDNDVVDEDDHEQTGRSEDSGGGEVEFVKRMIQDSLVLRDRVRVYTTMLGRKTSLRPLKREIAKHNIRNFYTTEFVQGRTTRWGLAWTLLDMHNISHNVKQQKIRKKRQKSPDRSEGDDEEVTEDEKVAVPVVKQRRIAVSNTMRQTINTGTMSAKQLFDLIVRELKKKKKDGEARQYGVETVDKIDSMMCNVTVEFYDSCCVLARTYRIR